MRMWMMVLRGGLILAPHAELRGADTSPRHPLGPYRVRFDGQAAQRRPDSVERDPGVDEGAENHVAGGPRRTVEVERRQDVHLTLRASPGAPPRASSSSAGPR